MTEGICFLICYLLGAFPTGKLVARSHGVAIEKTGSGNVGATNVARTIGKKAGFMTLGGDVLKGILAIVFAQIWWALFIGTTFINTTDAGLLPTAATLSNHLGMAGLAVVLGHCISIPTVLRGGKGVATALGVLLVLQPTVALLTTGTFLTLLAVSKIVSLSSITAALTMPIFYLFIAKVSVVQPGTQFYPLAAIAMTVVARHWQNIKRLIEGSEPRISVSSKS